MNNPFTGRQDMNTWCINDEHRAEPLSDPSCCSGETEVVFRSVRDRLLRFIDESPAVVGCVAWLTCPTILRALSSRKMVSLIVQKEDFLKPDLAASPRWQKELRRLYAALPKGCRYDVGGLVSALCYCGDSRLDPVRCTGNHNADRNPVHPRMHHKFIVRCEERRRLIDGRFERIDLEPLSVWTGSFNFSKSAGYSLENAVIINNPRIARAYFDEWSQVCALSEPLDWETEWAEPEWRIGS